MQILQRSKSTNAFSFPLYCNQYQSVVEIVLRLIFQASLEEQASMYREIMMISRDIMEQQVLVVMNKIKIWIVRILQIQRYLPSD